RARGDPTARHPDGGRESDVGLHADPRRIEECWVTCPRQPVGCINSTWLTLHADIHATSLQDDRGERQSVPSTARRPWSPTGGPAARGSDFGVADAGCNDQ